MKNNSPEIRYYWMEQTSSIPKEPENEGPYYSQESFNPEGSFQNKEDAIEHLNYMHKIYDIQYRSFILMEIYLFTKKYKG